MKYTAIIIMLLSIITSTPVHNSPDVASKENEQKTNQNSQVIVLNFINSSNKNSTSESTSPTDASSNNVMDKQSISSMIEKKLQSVDANTNPQQSGSNNQDLVNMTSQTSSMSIAKSSDSQGNIVSEQSSNQINTNTDVSNKVYKFSTPYMNLNIKFDAKNNRGIIVVQPNTASPDNNAEKPIENNDNPTPAENANQPPKENENSSEDTSTQITAQQPKIENQSAQTAQQSNVEALKQQSNVENLNAQASPQQATIETSNLQSLPQLPNVDNLNTQTLPQQPKLENLNAQASSPKVITESKGSGNDVGSSKGPNSSLYSGNGYNAISGPSGTIIYSTNYGSTLGEASFNSNTNAAAHSNFSN